MAAVDIIQPAPRQNLGTPKRVASSAEERYFSRRCETDNGARLNAPLALA